MKFRNYRNPYTNDNRIYSNKDLYNMSLGEFIKRKQEVLSQYRVLGVPTEKELQDSDNVVHVEAYTKEDGTEVKAHYRSKPHSGGVVNDNKEKEIKTENISEEKINEEQGQQKQTLEQKEQEKDKRMYPDEIAGVKRGEPKTFEQMMQQGVNPKYMSEKDENDEYSKNCQSCTVAAELVIRGYDVEAGPYSTPEAKELGSNGNTAYLDPETGEECVADIIYTNEIDCYDYLEQNVKQGERYELAYNTPKESGDKEYDKEHENDGHVVLITRNEKGEILYYDPQRYERFEGKAARDFISTWFQYEHIISAPPRILRIDNKALNPKYVNAVVRKRSN